MQENTISDVREALARGDRETALAMIDRILTANPTAEGWTLAAEIMVSEADKIKCLDQALALDPNYEPARTMYASLGQLPQPRTTSAPAEPRRSTPLPTLDFPDDDQDADTDKVRRENGQTITVEGVYEMLWDCKYCSTKKLLGKTHKFCPVCGAQQDPEWRYYPSDEEKVAVKDHVFVGADKICPNCSSLNVADAEFCTRCGAPQSAASAVKAQAARDAATSAGLTGVQSFQTEDLDARQMAEKFPHLRPKAAASKRPKWLFPVIGAVVLGVIAFVLFAVFAKRDESGYVSALNWERSIDIERYVAVQNSQICPAPADAYNVSSRYEQVGSRQVPDGETCSSRQVDQGDGTFRQERVCTTRYRSEPVYDDVCYYTVNRWGFSRTVEANSATSANLAWPVTNLNSAVGNSSRCSGLLPVLGCEKEGTRKETYQVIITMDNGRTQTCEVPFDEWQEITVESTFTFKVRVIGGGIDCSTLQRTG
jgi:RNA polymerase subunit RPABC4/transcription elongation factor Spt4